jgi:hypothetical protein
MRDMYPFDSMGRRLIVAAASKENKLFPYACQEHTHQSLSTLGAGATVSFFIFRGPNGSNLCEVSFGSTGPAQPRKYVL